MDNHYCRVCGLFYEIPPWGVNGDAPNYEHCFCCGVEFGNGDYTPESARRFRDEWIKDGALWSEEEFKPNEWDREMQLKNIPIEFK